MSKVIIGKADNRNVGFDIAELLTTRLLVQANSGGGKSWLLRRLAEQLFGKVQTIIIDPEGEFFTLREKFGYVLVGEGGETPADVRSAALLAQKFMELKVSAVCDLFEAFRSRPNERRQWVRFFLNALLEVPRNQWSPLIVIVDEAHKFCPQETPKAGNQQEREIIAGCKDAMIALATTGRKRGFCPVWATQRLAKLDKDASAELFNRLVGMTIEDVDVDRAADLMSVSKEQRQDFRISLRTLNPGQFYAFGRAISNVRELVTVAGIETRHPESGAAAKYSAPPPMPEAVAKLLPKLADLPKAAEEKARTEAEFRREIRELKMQLRAAEHGAAATAPVQQSAIQKAVDSALRKREQEHKAEVRNYAIAISKMDGVLTGVAKQVGAALGYLGSNWQQMKTKGRSESAFRHEDALHQRSDNDTGPGKSVTRREPVGVVRREEPNSNTNGSGELSGPERRILNAIAWLNTIGVNDPEQVAVAFLAGYTYGGGAFNNPRGRLNQRGFVQYVPGDRIRLTGEGERMAEAPNAPLDAAELQRMVLQRLPGPERKILAALLEEPEGLTNEELSARAGYSDGGGAYNNPRGRLRSLGLVEYSAGKVVPKPLLFLETA